MTRAFGAVRRSPAVAPRQNAPCVSTVTCIDREGFAELLTEAVRTYG